MKQKPHCDLNSSRHLACCSHQAAKANQCKPMTCSRLSSILEARWEWAAAATTARRRSDETRRRTERVAALSRETAAVQGRGSRRSLATASALPSPSPRDRTNAMAEANSRDRTHMAAQGSATTELPFAFSPPLGGGLRVSHLDHRLLMMMCTRKAHLSFSSLIIAYSFAINLLTNSFLF